MQPASETKRQKQLRYEFGGRTLLLSQRDDHGLTNGTTLWLGGQVLSHYLASVLGGPVDAEKRKRAIELGSGVGLTALTLHALGWSVCATDVEPVLSTVLRPNLTANELPLQSVTGVEANSLRHVHVLESKELNWAIPTESWCWERPGHITLDASRPSLLSATDTKLPLQSRSEDSLSPPFDLIVTADTIYTPDLLPPLLRSLNHLASLSIASGGKYSCPVYVAVERRDSRLMDRAYEDCSNVWGFKVEKVRVSKIKKVLERANLSWTAPSAWEGVEIWKMRLPASAVCGVATTP